MKDFICKHFHKKQHKKLKMIRVRESGDLKIVYDCGKCGRRFEE